MKADYQQHPLSAAFPKMSGADLDQLATDIQEHGQHEPGTLFEGKVLDGWHRYLACIRADVIFVANHYKGKDPRAFVRSKNWHRRHMTVAQRALAEVALREWAPVGRPGNSAPGAELNSSEMAKAAGVSTRSIEQAKVVEANGSDQLKDAVRQGNVSLKTAEPIARKPKSQQAKAMKEKPEPKPKPLAHESAKTSARIKELSARIVELEADIADLTEKNDALGDIASSIDAFQNKDEFKAMQILRIELRGAKRAEDTAKRTCNEMRKQIAYWKKRAEKCEGKK